VRLSESTISECLKHFCAAVVNRFASNYLRSSTLEDLQAIEAEYCKLDFPGCIGCLDCVSWSWDKCPVVDQGRYGGRDKNPNVRMEVICDDKLRIWHLFFGVPGSRNDINIVNMSPLFLMIRTGTWPPGKPQRQFLGSLWTGSISCVVPSFLVFEYSQRLSEIHNLYGGSYMRRHKKVPDNLLNVFTASCSLDFILYTDPLVYGTRRTWLMWLRLAALSTK
jgi:hypothetical protein